MYCNRTATGPVQAGTQRTIRSLDRTKYLQISGHYGHYGHIRTHWTRFTRIVAPKVAGSSPFVSLIVNLRAAGPTRRWGRRTHSGAVW